MDNISDEDNKTQIDFDEERKFEKGLSESEDNKNKEEEKQMRKN